MCKDRTIWIVPCLCAVIRHQGFCKYISVSVNDISPDNSFGKQILPLVIRTVYKTSCAGNGKVNNINHKGNKQNYKEVGDPCKFFISSAFSAFASSSVSASGLLRISACFSLSFARYFFPVHFSAPFLFSVLSFLLHLLSVYKVPE